MTTRPLFVTRLYEGSLAAERGFETFRRELEDACRSLARDDAAGRAWSTAHAYPGYTSYASLNDLPLRDPAFAELKRRIDRHVARFAEEAHMDLGGRRLKLDSLWVNVLKPGGAHTGHIHPHSVVSGTVYVSTPEGASALKLEDPRLPMMMAAPSRTADAPEEARTFVYVRPEPGTVLLWESWLRHEVPANAAKSDRISVSFNYR
ncbi:MAG TPA: TIGR02466 family protein [Caulobacteraceae bacterium]|nr:TIGR02466 family protein [Caulobacteraceae bacterium]